MLLGVTLLLSISKVSTVVNIVEINCKFCHDSTLQSSVNIQFSDLLEFYDALDGENWSVDESSAWNISGETSASTLAEATALFDKMEFGEGLTWNSDDRLIGLNLTNLDLTGDIPDGISVLTELEVLALSDNYITGDFPEIPSAVSDAELQCNLLNCDR